jgi:DNA transposition AAA+ family ATPase
MRVAGTRNRHASPEHLRKIAQLERTADRRHRVQELARAYLNRTGMATADFAHRIGYGYTTLQKFLTDRYENVGGDDSPICAALLEFMERYPIQPTGSFTGKLYEIGNVRCLRQIFARVLDRPQIFMVYAPPGSGKTDVTRGLIAEHNRTAAHAERARHLFHIYCRAGIRPRDLLRRVAQACGTSIAGEIDRILQNILWEFRGQRVALVFDEAQHLSIDCLETVRELFDQGGFSLIFTGSHELDQIFSKFAGTLEQLERRVTDKVTLPAVTREEAAGIVRSELEPVCAGVDSSLVQQQIELATVEVAVRRQKQRYISIGRLMAALREAREALAAAQPEPAEERIEVPA